MYAVGKENARHFLCFVHSESNYSGLGQEKYKKVTDFLVGFLLKSLDNTFFLCYTNQDLCGSGSVVERHLAKVNVASSNLVFRSNLRDTCFLMKQVFFCPEN